MTRPLRVAHIVATAGASGAESYLLALLPSWVGAMAAELNKGRVEIRNDKEGNIHAIFGKTSFKEEELLNNLKVFLQAIRDGKPTGVKGTYLNSVTLNSTMGPGIKVEPNAAQSMQAVE